MRYSELIESETPGVKFRHLYAYDKELPVDDIMCWGYDLITLDGAPNTILGDFNCSSNLLTTLVGGPTNVGGDFDCSNNPLTDLIGSPITIGGDLDCGKNGGTISLTGITTKSINKRFICLGTVTGLMALWKIKGIKAVEFFNMPKIQNITNRHIGNPRGALAFQADMIDAGFKEYL